MKKLLALILAAALALSLVACGGGSGAGDSNTPSTPDTGNGDTTSTDTPSGGDNTPDETNEPTDDIEDATRYQLDDTVSTDIIELTVKKASLAYYATAASTSTDGENRTVNIDEAYEPADKGFFKCNKGSVIVCLDFVITNTDRDSLNTDNYMPSFEIRQNGEVFNVGGYDLNGTRFSINLTYASIAKNNGNFVTNKTGNIIMNASTSYEIKTVGIAGFEAEDLSAPFELIVTIKDSSGNTEQFTYSIGE